MMKTNTKVPAESIATPRQATCRHALLNLTRVFTRGVLFLSVACVLTACPQETEVWVARNSSATELTLNFGAHQGRQGSIAIGIVRVARCDNAQTMKDLMWVIKSNGNTQSIDHLVYGITPDGFHSEKAASPLTAGCYVVQVSGTGRTQFRILPNGTVNDEGRPW